MSLTNVAMSCDSATRFSGLMDLLDCFSTGVVRDKVDVDEGDARDTLREAVEEGEDVEKPILEEKRPFELF